jgi:hypothetical protein
MYIEHGTGAFDTSACTHVGAAFRPIADSELDAGAITVKNRLSVIVMVISANGGHIGRAEEPGPCTRCMTTVYGPVDALALIMHRSLGHSLRAHL